jgi:hypothetical protein
MRSLRLLAALSAVALGLAGCAKAKPQAETATTKAATIVAIPGTDRVRVRLTPEAVKRLDIQTGTVRDALVAPRPTVPPADGAVVPPAHPMLRRVVAFSAVMYAPTGDAFAYMTAGPQLYERTPIVVEYVTGDLAVLSSGPPSGTSVVTVGAPELSGVELGTGE